MTLVGSDMIRLLEETLPARFGGGPQDYQLVEEEHEAGFTRLSLLVSQKVGIEDEAAVIAAVLDALGRASLAGDLVGAVWSKAGTLRVKRMEPVWTDRGKLMPLHLVRRAERSDGPAEALPR